MPIKLSLVQFSPKYADLESNIEFISNTIQNDDSDIIVFPELSTSGYFFLSKLELSDYVLRADGEIMSRFQTMSTELNKVIVIGFAEKDKNLFYNSAAVLMPNKYESKVYRKSHLFYKERFVFEEGNTGFFNIYWAEKDVNLGTMICYDWRFPEAARTLALKGADVILCPSNLVTGVWKEAMRTRALENKVYIAVANRIGSESLNDETLEFNGESAIISYNGHHLVSAGADNQIIIEAEIEPYKTRNKSFNEINNIFNDRRPDLYL